MKAGSIAGSFTTSGHRRVSIKGVSVYAHRIVWALIYGEWPETDIDHIDGNPANNRITNLRLATISQNSANRPAPRNNKTGFKGVSCPRENGKYVVYVSTKKIGEFVSIEEAAHAYDKAALARYGEFAHLNFKENAHG